MRVTQSKTTPQINFKGGGGLGGPGPPFVYGKKTYIGRNLFHVQTVHFKTSLSVQLVKVRG